MTRALNIKIQDAIYSQLDQHAREHNVTKTQIVEKALSQWFSGNVDENVDSVDEDVDTPKDKDSYLESSNDIEKIINNKIAEYLLGVTCLVPDVDNVDSSVDEDVDGDVDNIDSSVDEDVQNNLPPYTQSELAKRLGVGASTLHKARSRKDFSEWSKARDPQGLEWQYGADKKYHPLQS